VLKTAVLSGVQVGVGALVIKRKALFFSQFVTVFQVFFILTIHFLTIAPLHFSTIAP
jgi:hypothetical protein